MLTQAAIASKIAEATKKIENDLIRRWQTGALLRGLDVDYIDQQLAVMRADCDAARRAMLMDVLTRLDALVLDLPAPEPARRAEQADEFDRPH
jgi:hypothetical protein